MRLTALTRTERMTCTECGYVCKSAAEFHPYLYCLLVKTGHAGLNRTPEQALREYGFERVKAGV